MHRVTRDADITIGMPVYNAGKFVSESIQSLQNQTYGDFLLTISDNGSTDNTVEICESAAKSDDRIIVERHEGNRGAVWNFNHVAQGVTSKYFCWAAADDLWSPGFLGSLRHQLESDPNAVLAFGCEERIDSSGAVVEGVTCPPKALASTDLVQRARAAFRQETCSHIYGLIRSDVLQRTGMLDVQWGADYRLLVELSLMGRFALVSEPLYRKRIFWDRGLPELANDLTGTGEKRIDMTRPYCEMMLNLARTVWKSSLTGATRRKILSELVTAGRSPATHLGRALRSELARGMQVALQEREIFKALGNAAVRTMVEPRTPLQVMKKLLLS